MSAFEEGAVGFVEDHAHADHAGAEALLREIGVHVVMIAN
jgi:hypothetical protein